MWFPENHTRLNRAGSILTLARNNLRSGPLSSLLEAIIPFAIGAVALVLVLGLWNMMRGGSPSRSQTLMRARVLLQFLAVVIMMTALWLMAR
jgi:hypothetical protein